MRYEKNKRLEDLEHQITDLKTRIPAYSVKPVMIQGIEKLEDKLRKVKNEER
jgi:hypothetical protein